MKNLLSGVWWKAALLRAARTAAIIAVPYVPTLVTDQAYILVLSAAGFGALTSLITSLWGLPESSGTTVPWYWAFTERIVKTAAQALLTAFGTATLFSEVSWDAVVPLVLTAVIGSALLGFLKTFPETEIPTAAATVVVNTINTTTGESTEKSAPAVVAIESDAEAERTLAQPDPVG